MDEKTKLLIMRILIIIAAILLIISFIMDLVMLSIGAATIVWIIIPVVLILICWKIDAIPQRAYILIILGIVIIILGVIYNFGMGLVGPIIAGVLVILAGVIDIAIKT